MQSIVYKQVTVSYLETDWVVTLFWEPGQTGAKGSFGVPLEPSYPGSWLLEEISLSSDPTQYDLCAVLDRKCELKIYLLAQESVLKLQDEGRGEED